MGIEDKRIWDWTFREIITYCADHRNTCVECPFCFGQEFEDCIFDSNTPPWTFNSMIKNLKEN